MKKRPRIRPKVYRVLALLFTMVATPAWAAVVGVLINPAQPILGNAFTASADLTGNTDYINSYQWAWERQIGACYIAPTWLGTLGSETVYLSAPGTYTMGLTNTYGVPPGSPPGTPAPPNTYRTKTVVIAPADKVKATIGATSGLQVPTSINGSRLLKFDVYSGTSKCGIYLGGTAQEKLTGRIHYGLTLPDTPWFPVAPSPTFQLVAGQIQDEHVEWAGTAWNTWPMNTVFWSATQHLQIVYGDPCLGTNVMSLSSWPIAHRKIAAWQWHVE